MKESEISNAVPLKETCVLLFYCPLSCSQVASSESERMLQALTLCNKHEGRHKESASPSWWEVFLLQEVLVIVQLMKNENAIMQ